MTTRPLPLQHYSLTQRIALTIGGPLLTPGLFIPDSMAIVDVNTGRLTELGAWAAKRNGSQDGQECVRYATMTGLFEPEGPTLAPAPIDERTDLPARLRAEQLDLCLGPSPRPIGWDYASNNDSQNGIGPAFGDLPSYEEA